MEARRYAKTGSVVGWDCSENEKILEQQKVPENDAGLFDLQSITVQLATRLDVKVIQERLSKRSLRFPSSRPSSVQALRRRINDVVLRRSKLTGNWGTSSYTRYKCFWLSLEFHKPF